MKFLQHLTDYIYDKELTINIYKNKINVVNYIDIDHFDSNKIIIKYDKGKILINGFNLVVTRLLDNELLISGEIKTIELG